MDLDKLSAKLLYQFSHVSSLIDSQITITYRSSQGSPYFTPLQPVLLHEAHGESLFKSHEEIRHTILVYIRLGSDRYVGRVGLIILPWELVSLFLALDHELLVPENGKRGKSKKSGQKWRFLVFFSAFHLIDQIFH